MPLGTVIYVYETAQHSTHQSGITAAKMRLYLAFLLLTVAVVAVLLMAVVLSGAYVTATRYRADMQQLRADVQQLRHEQAEHNQRLSRLEDRVQLLSDDVTTLSAKCSQAANASND